MPEVTSMSTPELVTAILKQYKLPVNGTHGPAHWARVQENGLLVAKTNDADHEVIRLFALFHDACRLNEHVDNNHGRRGAQLAQDFRGRYFDIGDDGFELLLTACRQHTDGLIDGDITVVTCWDADRLDLGRAGITPSGHYLGNAASRDPELMEWAHRRSCEGHVPPLLLEEWGIETPEFLGHHRFARHGFGARFRGKSARGFGLFNP